MRLLLAAFLLASATVACGRAEAAGPAAGCGAHRLGEVPIVLRHLVPLVSASINGVPTTLIVDTGAERTVLTAAAVRRLGLQGHYQYGRPIRGLNGRLDGGDIDLGNITVGGADLPATHILVGALSLPSIDGVAPDGLLGADALSAFDVDFDLIDERLGLYERQNCAGAMPGWTGTYATVPANLSLHNHLFFQIRLDGHALHAFFDTGSQGNVIDTAAAVALGVTPQMLASDPAAVTHGVTAETRIARRHVFSRLDVATDIQRNPGLIVTRLGLVDGDVILGIEYLLGHRLWLSYAGNRIFFMPAR